MAAIVPCDNSNFSAKFEKKNVAFVIDTRVNCCCQAKTQFLYTKKVVENTNF